MVPTFSVPSTISVVFFSSGNNKIEFDNDDFYDLFEFALFVSLRIPNKYKRGFQNYFEIYYNSKFKKLFKFSKVTVREAWKSNACIIFVAALHCYLHTVLYITESMFSVAFLAVLDENAKVYARIP